MKKLLIALALLAGLSSYAAPPEISEKVLKAFRETFTDAKNVEWNEYDNYYSVKFKQTNIDTMVRYNKEGDIIQTTRYYFEQNLPPMILAKVKKRYANKTVYGVTEIASESDVVYYIVLEDEKNWLT